jgi:hypothetical protein
MTPGWILRRALVGALILFVFVSGAALLMHAGIDPQDAGDVTAQPLSTAGPSPTAARPL